MVIAIILRQMLIVVGHTAKKSMMHDYIHKLGLCDNRGDNNNNAIIAIKKLI